MKKEKIISQGAEAILIQEDNNIIKKRIKKSYRIPEIDEKLRKTRTKKESKIIEKLQGKVNVPKLIKTDEKSKEIILEFIKGRKISENLDSFPIEEQKQIIIKIAEQVAILHNLGIIHNDLTTSNMILNSNKEVFLIDFGLSFHSDKIEDKAVDIHLFKQALESKHFQHYEILFSTFMKSYNPDNKEKILTQFKKVEARGRYKH